MKLGGLMKFTLLDYPGKLACTVFTKGCNLRCPFCHNASLVSPERVADEISEEDFFSFLDTRCGILEGVAVSGGEPLLQKDIEAFLSRIRDMGYLIKLDTNGAFPQKLRDILNAGLADYVAMDIKNSPEKYAITSGGNVLEQIDQSIKLLMASDTEYEFRTTAVSPLHSAEDFEKIGEWIRGADKYFIQSFTDSGDILCDNGFSSPSDEELRLFLELARKNVPNAALRGH